MPDWARRRYFRRTNSNVLPSRRCRLLAAVVIRPSNSSRCITLVPCFSNISTQINKEDLDLETAETKPLAKPVRSKVSSLLQKFQTSKRKCGGAPSFRNQILISTAKNKSSRLIKKFQIFISIHLMWQYE